MKNELKAMLEVIDEKINKEEDKLEQTELNLSNEYTHLGYEFHLGKLRILREVKSMLEDLLKE